MCFCDESEPPDAGKKCPYPHWPPVLPPIAAVIMSILMIPCYCYSCGPWSGPYWAEQREKMDKQYDQELMVTHLHAAQHGFNSAARIRPKHKRTIQLY